MKKFIPSVLLVGPMIAFAQVSGPFGNFLILIQDLLDYLIPLMLSLGVLVFLWGLVKFIANADDESAKEAGKSLMIWGMIALFVMVAFWSIIGFVQESLGITGMITSTPAPVVHFGP